MVGNDFKKDFMNLMKDERLNLPKRVRTSYASDLEELLDYYIEVTKFAKRDLYEEIKKICQLIVKIVNTNNSSKANHLMEELMEKTKILEHLKIHDKELPIDGYAISVNRYFRVREVSENREYDIKDIFHTPMSAKTLTKVSRYNDAGSPQLYLSSTIKQCIEEIQGSNKKYIIGSMFQLKEGSKFKVFDLGVRPIDFVRAKIADKNRKANSYLLSSYMIVYPLIAACSYIACSKESSMPNEYILTHALANYIKSKYDDEVCGIRYFSCMTPGYCMVNDKEIIDENVGLKSFTKYHINTVFFIESDLNENQSVKLRKAFTCTSPRHFMDSHYDEKQFEKSIKYYTKKETFNL